MSPFRSHLISKRQLVGGKLRLIEMTRNGSPVQYMKRMGRPCFAPFPMKKAKSGAGFLSSLLGSVGLGMQKADPGTVGDQIMTAIVNRNNPVSIGKTILSSLDSRKRRKIR